MQAIHPGKEKAKGKYDASTAKATESSRSERGKLGASHLTHLVPGVPHLNTERADWVDHHL